MLQHVTVTQVLPWLFIFPAVALLWVPRWRRLGLLLAILGYAAAFVPGELTPLSLIPIAFLLVLGYAVNTDASILWRTAAIASFVAWAFILRAHVWPGFHNLLIATGRVTPDAVHYKMYLNLDETLVLFWLVFAWKPLRLAASPRVWIPNGIVFAAIATAACALVALPLGMTAWEPKWPSLTPLWALNNLLLVSFGDEALFRGFIQGGIERGLHKHPWAPWLAVGVGALLFGAVHLRGGLVLAGCAAIAGICNGLAYRRGGLPAAALSHAGLNVVQFFLFAYPMLRP